MPFWQDQAMRMTAKAAFGLPEHLSTQLLRQIFGASMKKTDNSRMITIALQRLPALSRVVSNEPLAFDDPQKWRTVRDKTDNWMVFISL
jgi:hypothetical protein